MEFAQYIQQYPDGKKIVLLTIDPDGGTPYRVSSARFNTLPGDATLPNVVFSSLINQDGVPRLHRSLRSIWGGGSVASWGPIVFSTWDYKEGQADFRTLDLYGKKVEIRLSGPNHLTQYSETILTLVGYLRSKRGTVTKGVTIEVADRKSILENIVPTERYVAADENAYFPTSNDGKVKQIVLGKWNNIPCTLINKNTNVYEVSDRRFPIKDIIEVYNNGVIVSFTKDLPNNQFTLAVPPNSQETITAKVEGVKDSVSGLLYVTLEEFMTWMVDQFTTLDPATEVDFDAALPTDDAQYFIPGEESIADHLDKICSSVIGTWFMTPLDTLSVKLIANPVPGGKSLSKRQYLQDVSWEQEEDVYYKIPFRYDTNAAPLTTLGAVDDAEKEIWLKETYRESSVDSGTILTAFPYAKVAEPIQTYFLAKSAALAVATRGLSLFGVQRYTSTILVPYVSPALAMLDSVNLIDADVMNGDCMIIEISEDLVSVTPTVELRVWK